MARPNVQRAMTNGLEKTNLANLMQESMRRRQRTGVSWSDVSALSLRCAMQSSLSQEVAVMFSPAAGGLGVCITVFQDGAKHKEYAMNGEELTAILDGLTEAFGSKSEDLRVSLAGGKD